MNNLLLLWTKRNLTILGKILIIKSLIVPIFTYVASACVVPEKYRKEIDSKCFKFIWNNKPNCFPFFLGKFYVHDLLLIIDCIELILIWESVCVQSAISRFVLLMLCQFPSLSVHDSAVRTKYLHLKFIWKEKKKIEKLNAY
jgi:hypothetical protein